ncbi:hypothetical protein P8C59_007240 [Phyllachora maydis]|uniref:Uncharacterized protein n=1 Tax=Phyllachora maydis TaxID=1825666 RepID=A0AAD9MHW5_9PEZI|nr:hypothetical protein P8C59_007240 [Phyllachora maydis]
MSQFPQRTVGAVRYAGTLHVLTPGAPAQHVLLPHAWGYTSYPSLLIIGEPAGSRLMYFAPLPISVTHLFLPRLGPSLCSLGLVTNRTQEQVTAFAG